MTSLQISPPDWPPFGLPLIQRLGNWIDEQARANSYAPGLSNDDVVRSQATIYGMRALVTQLAAVYKRQNEREALGGINSQEATEGARPSQPARGDHPKC